MADNGSRQSSLKFKSIEEALEAKRKIDKVYVSRYPHDGNISEEDEDFIWVCELIHDHTAIGGYINSVAEIFKLEQRITKIT